MIVILFLATQSFLRSLNHFLDSLRPKVASQRGPRFCDPRELGHTSWLYLFLWEISRSLNLALADPQRAAITVRKAPCNYKHHLLFISGQNENACEYDGLLYPGWWHDCTVSSGLISFPIKYPWRSGKEKYLLFWNRFKIRAIQSRGDIITISIH